MSSDYDRVQEELLRQLTDAGAVQPQAPAGPPPAVPDHRLLRRIGGGSYGEVWLARNVVGTCRAVKVVYRNRFSSSRPYEREFHGMQRYEPVSRRHEGLVDILQIGRNDDAGFFYYVMELADDAAGGPPLAAPPEDVKKAMAAAGRRRQETGPSPGTSVETAAEPAVQEVAPDAYHPRTLSSEIRRSGRLPAADCVPLFLTLTSALSALHRNGLLHRDIKPSNIVIVGGVPKLADIGLVAEAGAEMSFVGTEGFIAPEGPGTAAADIYALGKMFYEAFTGLDRLQFPSLPAGKEAMGEVKAMLELSAVANRACAPDPARRYQSAEELLADLALLHSGRSVQRLRTVEKRLHRARRFGLIAAAAAVAAIGTGLLLQKLRSTEQREREALAEALTEAKLQRAVAERIAGRPGSRFSVLEAVKEAARSRPGDPLLRSEAITALARADIRAVSTYAPERSTIFSFAWNRDQSQTVVAEAAGGVRVEQADGTVRARLQSGEPLLPLALGDSGRWLLTVTEKNACGLWDVPAGKEVWRSAENTPNAILDPAERWFMYSGLTDQGAWVRRDLHSGEEVPVPPLPGKNPAGGVTRSGIVNGRIARGWQYGQNIEILDAATMQVAAQCALPEDAKLFSLTLSDDGRRLAAGTSEFRNFSFDLSEPQRRPAESALHQGAVINMNFSQDGEVFFSTAWDHSTRLIESSTGRQLVMLPSWSLLNGNDPPDRHYWRVDAVSFSLQRYEYATPVCRVFADPPAPRGMQAPDDVMWSPDGTMLAVSSWEGVRLLDGRTGAFLALLPSGGGACGTVFRDDGSVFTAGASVKHWPAVKKDGELQLGPPKVLRRGHSWALRSDRSGRVQAGAFEQAVQRWQPDKESFTPVQEPSDPVHYAYRLLEVSPDGKWIATGQIGQFKVWEAATGKLAWTGLSSQSWMPAFSPDSRIMVANDLRRAAAWDVATRKLLWETPLPEAQGILSAWSPDGRMLILSRQARNLVALDAQTGKVLCEWNHPDGAPVASIAFSPDGRRLAVSRHSGVVHLWDLPALREGLKACGVDFPLPEIGPASGPAAAPPKVKVIL